MSTELDEYTDCESYDFYIRGQGWYEATLALQATEVHIPTYCLCRYVPTNTESENDSFDSDIDVILEELCHQTQTSPDIPDQAIPDTSESDIEIESALANRGLLIEEGYIYAFGMDLIYTFGRDLKIAGMQWCTYSRTTQTYHFRITMAIT
jgi:hypothetical protein